MMEVVSGDNFTGDLYMCNTPVKSSPPTYKHVTFLQAGCPSCHQTNSVRALKKKYVNIYLYVIWQPMLECL